MAYKAKQPEDRFWRYVKKVDNGCWEWLGCLSKNGYGVFSVPHIPGENKHSYAHRFSWELHFGSIPEGKVICHKCDNPSCLNPEHLFIGTQKDNLADMVKKNRGAHGERNGNTKLKEEEVIRIFKWEGVKKRIAEEYGISYQCVYDIKRGRRWARVTAPFREED